MLEFEAGLEGARSSSLGDLIPACPLGNPARLEPPTRLTPQPIRPRPCFLGKAPQPGPVACKRGSTARAASPGQQEVSQEKCGKVILGWSLCRGDLCPPVLEAGA